MKMAPCTDCGFMPAHPTQMDWDHIRGEKIDTVNRLLRFHGRSLEEVRAEIAKCELVCANCHRLRTVQRATTPF